MLTAKQINELKAKEKTEMARRSGYGSLAGFAGTAYDFTVTPVKGGGILAEHGKKTINPLLNVKDHAGLVLVDGETPEGVTPSTSGDPIPAAFDEELIAEVDKLAAESMTGNSSSCRGACTGLCLGTCTSSCSGCSGSCSSSCGGSCGGCTGCSSCGSSCSNGCSGCSGACAQACASCCGSHCSGCDSCTGCGDGCTGCDGSCSSGCSSSCSGGCTGCTGCGSSCGGCRC